MAADATFFFLLPLFKARVRLLFRLLVTIVLEPDPPFAAIKAPPSEPKHGELVERHAGFCFEAS